MHQIVGLPAVPPAGAAHRHRQILGVTGGGCDRHGDAREGGRGGVVQVAGKDAANIRAPHNRGQLGLTAQLHRDRQVEHRRDRRVVQRQNGAVRCRLSEHT